MSSDLRGRVAVITGAGNGLGRAIAIALADAGVTAVLMGRDASKLEAVEAEIAALGGSALSIRCDTGDEASVADAAAQLADREVSILVNNAGVAGPVAQLIDIDIADWDDTFAVNVRGVFLMCRAFLPGMLDRGVGDIVNVSSVAAKRPLPGRTPYGASKAALLGLTTTLSSEVAARGVKVNSLSPGPIAGPRMTRNFTLEAERRGITVQQAEEEYVSKAASKRMVTESEVADAALAIIRLGGLNGADIDLTAGMFAR